MIKVFEKIGYEEEQVIRALMSRERCRAEITVLIPSTDSPLSCCPEPLFSVRESRLAPVKVRR